MRIYQIIIDKNYEILCFNDHNKLDIHNFILENIYIKEKFSLLDSNWIGNIKDLDYHYSKRKYNLDINNINKIINFIKNNNYSENNYLIIEKYINEKKFNEYFKFYHDEYYQLSNFIKFNDKIEFNGYHYFLMFILKQKLNQKILIFF